MNFVKLDADIPSCCRLHFDCPDFEADTMIAALPQDGENVGKANRLREKWILTAPGRGNTPLLGQWPDLERFLDTFPGRCIYAQISQIKPQTKLGIHRDGFDPHGERMKHYDMFNSTLRFHSPLQTSDAVYVYSDGSLYNFRKGEVWMLNNMKTHAVANDDEHLTRYHLIFDVEPNEETLALIDEAEKGQGREDRDLLEKFWPDTKH